MGELFSQELILAHIYTVAILNLKRAVVWDMHITTKSTNFQLIFTLSFFFIAKYP